MPARYKELESLSGLLDQAVADGTISEATAESAIDAYKASNPSAFTNESDLSDEQIAKKALEFTRRHLRRFPKTQSALALSLKSLFEGESTSYIP